MCPVCVLAALLLPEGMSSSEGGIWSAGAVSNSILQILSLVLFFSLISLFSHEIMSINSI